MPFISPGRLRSADGEGCPGSFDFLGFTLHWGRSRKGKDVVRLKTAKSRLRRSLRQMTEWCRRNRHRPVAEQARVLSLKMRGHYSYYGITGNARMLGRFAFEVRAIWRKWLGRRNNRGMSWERFYQLLEHHALPAPLAPALT